VAPDNIFNLIINSLFSQAGTDATVFLVSPETTVDQPFHETNSILLGI
jgi:hypothetical protein